MNYTLWRRGVLLGRTDFAMPSPRSRYRAGQLQPTVEFERVWPELGPAMREVIAAGAAARLRAASEVLDALGLELRDAAGRPVATQTVMVQEVRPPAWIPAWAIAREVEEARKEGLEIRVPSYVVIARDVADASVTGPASRPPT